MAVYQPTGTGNIHIDAVLTQISLGWPNNGLIGDVLFPTVQVRKQSDKYFVFGRESWLPETSDYRAPGTEANEIPGLQVSLSPYYAQEHALQIAVTDEERENADSQFSPDRDGTELVTSKIHLGREVAIKNKVTTVANYATGMSLDLSGTPTAQWNDYTNSDPIAAVRVAVRAIHAKLFMEPNLAIIPYQVMSVLQDHPKIIERIKYSERAVLTPEIIAAVLGLNRVLVPGVGIGSGSAGQPSGTAGNAVTASYLWGKDVLFAWVPARPGLRTPAFGYEFVWSYPGAGAQAVDRWREEKRKSDVIRVGRRYDLQFVGVGINPGDAATYNKVISGYLIKNVIA
jgi:hypothetical protein